MMDDTFFQERMVLCQQGILAQHLRGLPHDDPYESQRNTEVEKIHRNLIGVVVGEYHLEKIQPMPEDQ